MKKSTIIVGVGAFIVVTALLCINPDGKMYEKQNNFQTSKEVLNQLESNPILAINDKGMKVETNQFKECLSKRKRLTDSQFHFENMKIEKVVELNEKEKEALIDDYNKNQEYLSMKPKITKVEPVRLEAKVSYPYRADDEKEESCNIDLVLIDEGEGLVVDYIVEYSTQEEKEKGDINANG